MCEISYKKIWEIIFTIHLDLNTWTISIKHCKMDADQPTPSKLGRFTILPLTLSSIDMSTMDDEETTNSSLTQSNSSINSKEDTTSPDGILNLPEETVPTAVPLASTDKDDTVLPVQVKICSHAENITDIIDSAYDKFQTMTEELGVKNKQAIGAMDSFVTMATRAQALVRKKLNTLADAESTSLAKHQEIRMEQQQQRSLTKDWMADMSNKFDGWEISIKERCDALKLSMDTDIILLERKLNEKYRGLEGNAGDTCEKLALYIDVSAQQMERVCKRINELKSDIVSLEQRTSLLHKQASNGSASQRKNPYPTREELHKEPRRSRESNVTAFTSGNRDKSTTEKESVIWSNKAVNVLCAIKENQRKTVAFKRPTVEPVEAKLPNKHNERPETKFLVTDLHDMTIANKSLGQLFQKMFHVSCTTIQYHKREANRTKYVNGIKKYLKWYLAVNLEKVKNTSSKSFNQFTTKLWVTLKFPLRNPGGPKRHKYKSFVLINKATPALNPNLPSKCMQFQAFEADYDQFRSLNSYKDWRASLGTYTLEKEEYLEISIDGTKLRLA